MNETFTKDYELYLEEQSLNLFQRLFYNKNIDDTPKASYHEILEKPKRGDIVSSYLQSNAFLTKFRYLSSRICGLAQGGRFTSLKAFKDKNTIIGYGVETKKNLIEAPMTVSENTFRAYLNKAGGCILMRPKNISDLQIDKFIEFIEKRKGTPYSYSDCTESAFKRIFEIVKETITGDTKTAKHLSKTFLEKYKRPLFCSSIIAMAYRYAKFNTKINFADIISWPIDFINSDSFEKICIYRK